MPTSGPAWREPDTPEKVIRLGCGGVFGLLAGFALGYLSEGLVGGVVFSVVGCILFATAALRLGDEFWRSLKDWVAKLSWWT